MHTLYDSRNPAPGVRVAPMISPRPQGLTMSQASLARTRGWKVTEDATGRVVANHSEIRTGGPVGLGMLSAAKISDHALRNGPVRNCPEHLNSVIPTTNAPLGTVRSGTKRRGAKKARKNTVCVYHMPTRREYRRKDGNRKLEYLRKTWLRLLGHGNPKLEAEYEECRESLLVLYPERAGELRMIECIKHLKRAI
jgi:hypothetical protein